MNVMSRFRFATTLLIVVAMTSCQQLPMVQSPSSNFNSRVNHLIIHFTSENFGESLRILTGSVDRPVSAHYLLPEPGDPTYDQSALVIYELVPTELRAWHAGVSYWAGKTGLNDQSIGSEIVNESRCLESIKALANSPAFADRCVFKPFSDEQIDLLIRLLQSILERYPDIRPHTIIGHSDIAPDRKIDPGPLFPWRQLYEAGIGAWYDDQRVETLTKALGSLQLSIDLQQRLLGAYGYKIEATGIEDTQSQLAVRAFQMHFRPRDYSGFFDTETLARLISLLERYRPEALAEIEDFPTL